MTRLSSGALDAGLVARPNRVLTSPRDAHHGVYGRTPRVGDLFEWCGNILRVTDVHDGGAMSWETAVPAPPPHRVTVDLGPLTAMAEGALLGALALEVGFLGLVLGLTLAFGGPA